MPEVLDATYYKDGDIRPVMAVVKSVACALSIGTGGSMLFAVELMLPELRTRTFPPVALATGAATVIGPMFFRMSPSFRMPKAAIMSTHGAPILTLLLFAGLGVVIGLAAAGFVRDMVFTEDRFNTIKNPYLRHGFGMPMVGQLIYGLMPSSGHYYVEGVGNATIQAFLQSHLAVGIGFLLLLLCSAKLFATTVWLDSGAFGGVVTLLGPVPGISWLNCTIIGMATMVGGATGATMAAVTMIFKMTPDYHIIIPVIVAVAWRSASTV